MLGAKAAELAMEKPLAVQATAARWAHRLRPTRLIRRIGQHGFAGILAGLAAVAACYGVLAVVGTLACLGFAVPIDARVWTGLIVALAAMAPLAIAWNLPVHRKVAPLLLGGVGALLVLYPFFGSYDWRIEAAGFATLLGAALLDASVPERRELLRWRGRQHHNEVETFAPSERLLRGQRHRYTPGAEH